MNPFDALSHLPQLVADYQATAERLIQAEAELRALKSDQYVGIEWVCTYWSVSEDTARDMIRVLSGGNPGRKGANDIKTLSYGTKIVRYRRSDIEKITTDNLVSLRDRLAAKRATKDKAGR